MTQISRPISKTVTLNLTQPADLGRFLSKVRCLYRSSLQDMGKKNYLTNRWQRTKINTSFSSWTAIECGVPQGSVLGPLLFNIYINDLFWVGTQTELCGWADHTTLHVCDINLESVIRRLEHDSLLIMEWFDSNYMKMNADKCHLLISGHKIQWIWAMIGTERIWESRSEKLLGVIIDKNLNFKDHKLSVCLKAGRKITALGRISKYLTLDKRKALFKAFIQSQFAYCPIVWMFHDRGIENKINRNGVRTVTTRTVTTWTFYHIRNLSH